MEIKIIRNGSTVFLGDNKRKAKVLQCCIRGSEETIEYQVAWWSGDNRKTAWVDSHEITYDQDNTSTVNIGYVS